DDPALDHLAQAPVEELRRRHERLVTALTEFDTAAVSTIHAFCQQMLGVLGLSSTVRPDGTVLEDQRPLLGAIVADLLVSRFHEQAGAPPVASLMAALEESLRSPD